MVFRPKGLKFFHFFRIDLPVSHGEDFMGCLDCGLLWSSVDGQKLERLLAKHGTRNSKVALKIKE
jgi:hypothetical protein